jgi:hypothetical protein
VDSFRKLQIGRGRLPKIARQFHTWPFSLSSRDGGRKGRAGWGGVGGARGRRKKKERKEKKKRRRGGGRSRKTRKAFRTNCQRRDRRGGRGAARVCGPVAPKTNYSDKPNYLPLLIAPSPVPPSTLAPHKKRTGCYEVLDLRAVGSRADVARPINVYIYAYVCPGVMA